jgi:hypothetical protein
MARSVTPVTFFVDWNSQIHAAGGLSSLSIPDQMRFTLDHVGRKIGKFLNRIDSFNRFSVDVRLYGGWIQGFQPTEWKKSLITITNDPNLVLSSAPNVEIRLPVAFGDYLLAALDIRFHQKLLCHLPNTLRVHNRVRRGRPDREEKMVDTALASDLLHLAHVERDSWLCVLGDDDDLVPPVLTAEAVRRGGPGRVYLLRTRPPGNFLMLAGLCEAP